MTVSCILVCFISIDVAVAVSERTLTCEEMVQCISPRWAKAVLNLSPLNNYINFNMNDYFLMMNFISPWFNTLHVCVRVYVCMCVKERYSNWRKILWGSWYILNLVLLWSDITGRVSIVEWTIVIDNSKQRIPIFEI